MAGKNRDKGQSHSTRPVGQGVPRWIRFSPEEVEALVVELAKMGYTPSMIGVILRDQYGIPLVKQVLGVKLTKVLEKHNLAPPVPEDLLRLMARAVNLRRHLFEHPKDTASYRGLIEIESKISALIKYYKRVGKLPKDFTYDPERAKVLVSQYLGRVMEATQVVAPTQQAEVVQEQISAEAASGQGEESPTQQTEGSSAM